MPSSRFPTESPIDDDLSRAHELILYGNGGAAALGIQVEPPSQRPPLEPELEYARVPLEEATRRRAEEAAVRFGTVTPAPQPPQPPPPPPPAPQDEVRAISVFEHPDLLDEALTHATRRILIISPWARRAVITTDFVSKLESRLRRGVTIHIAHGYEQDDSGSDKDALRRLTNLADRFPQFTFTRLQSTHAKILLFDDTWIATSFNWLSFKGSRDRTYRMEEGTLVRGQAVDAQYQRYIDLIDRDRL